MAMLVAWLFDAGQLARIRPDHLIPGPFTSLSFLLLSVFLILYTHWPSERVYGCLAVFICAGVFVYGLSVLVEESLGQGMILEQLLPGSIGNINGIHANASSPVTGMGLMLHVINSDLQVLNPALVSTTLAILFLVISGLLFARLVQKVGGSIDRAEKERQIATSQLRKSEDNYRRLFEDPPLPLAVHSKGLLIDINRAAVELNGGESAEELIGSNVVEFVHLDYRQMAAERMRQVGENCGMAPAGEEKFLTMGGRVIDVSVTAMGIKYRDENAVQVAMLDITEKKLLEVQLRQAQKMESVDTLAGGIANDFNNYLTAVEGYIDLSLMDLPADTPVREELTEARRSSDRAADLTRQVLLFSRREPMDLKPCDLSKIISDMHRMLDRLLGERYKLETSLAEKVRTVKADPGHMDQVIMNLVVNARDAMPDGGGIRIGTENIAVDMIYASEHAGASPGEYVCLMVNDNGAGMDRDTMSQIFDPFFSTKKGAGGMGLGLSVVCGIVSQHGGWIDVDSTPGEGTEFRVFIPAIPHEAETASEMPVPVEELKGQGERVLLVDDEEAVKGPGQQVAQRT